MDKSQSYDCFYDIFIKLWITGFLAILIPVNKSEGDWKLDTDNALWKSVLGEIELSVSDVNYKTWFKPTEVIEYTGDNLTIAVANIFAKKQFEVKFDKQIRDILVKNGISDIKIDYVVKTKSTIKRGSRETTLIEEQLNPAGATSRANAVSELVGTSSSSKSTLNPRYTFDNFVVGSSNDLAYAACQAVVANVGTKYNPLFIYGGVGLGKTHLIQATGNAILKINPNAKILYINTETFVREYVEMIRFKKKNISDKYRSVDVLIVDDMQFIAGKEKVQEEFFHTFNTLHQSNKQIIISSDKPPKSIPTLTERLRSRFEWGMSIDIQMPDFETRSAIIDIKSSASGIKLDRDVIEYLAENIKTNIRELEGVLNHLLAVAEMRGIAPNIDTAVALLGDVRKFRPKHLTAKQIIEKTANYFQIDVADICGIKRDKYIVTPRQIAMYLLRSELHLSFPIIAKELGRKDHTTAMHSINKIQKQTKLDQQIREDVENIKEKLYDL